MTVPRDNGLSLAAEFPAATREDWQHLVEGVLRKTGVTDVAGTAAEDALSTELQDGLSTRPLYTAEDGAFDVGYPGFPPFVRGGTAAGSVVAGWDVRQRHTDPDPKQANEAVLADLENGVTSLWLRVGGTGVPPADLATVLEGVYLDLAPVVLDAGSEYEAAARAFLRVCDDREVKHEAVLGNLGADPLGQLAATGEQADSGAAAELARLCDREYPGLRALTVDALPYHEAGGSTGQELGCSLATGVGYLRDLTSAGLSIDAACGQLEFRYAATADQFLTIAKLRAARRLWARVAQVCGASPAAGAQRQHVVTSSVMMTRRDPWVNMLRTTVACLGAGVGGADAITVLPFDDALGPPDAFARRIARNTLSILMEESSLARVIDPAGGSWYVERLTDDLCRVAWSWFQELERAGGQAAALGSGLVADRLSKTWAERSADLAHRREPITGVSEYPNLAEQPLRRKQSPEAKPLATEVASPERPSETESLETTESLKSTAPEVKPRKGVPVVRRAAAPGVRRRLEPDGRREIPREAAPVQSRGGLPKVHRDEAFEALRARSDAHLVVTGARPRVFLAGLGPASVHTARMAFATNLFQAGGIEPVSGGAGTVAEAFARSGAVTACLCSSDELYAEQGEVAAAMLKTAGARRVFLAGRPGDRRDVYRRAGVDEFVFAGGDAIALLSAALDLMGVA